MDSAGYWTIGFGNRYINGKEVTKNTPSILMEEAIQLFMTSLKSYEDGVRESVKIILKQNQYDALVSLCYNIGTVGFKNSTLLQHLNQGKITRADFLLYIKARDQITGQLKVIQGLVNRRNKEADLFGL